MINRPPRNNFAFRPNAPQVPPTRADHAEAIIYNSNLLVGTRTSNSNASRTALSNGAEYEARILHSLVPDLAPPQEGNQAAMMAAIENLGNQMAAGHEQLTQQIQVPLGGIDNSLDQLGAEVAALRHLMLDTRNRATKTHNLVCEDGTRVNYEVILYLSDDGSLKDPTVQPHFLPPLRTRRIIDELTDLQAAQYYALYYPDGQAQLAGNQKQQIALAVGAYGRL